MENLKDIRLYDLQQELISRYKDEIKSYEEIQQKYPDDFFYAINHNKKIIRLLESGRDEKTKKAIEKMDDLFKYLDEKMDYNEISKVKSIINEIKENLKEG